LRKMTQLVALVPPIVAFLLLKPPSFGDEVLVQLSTSQWVAVLTALPAAVFYGIYYKAALAHPESAMALGLEEFYKLHPEAAPGAEPEPTKAAEKKTAGEESEAPPPE